MKIVPSVDWDNNLVDTPRTSIVWSISQTTQKLVCYGVLTPKRLAKAFDFVDSESDTTFMKERFARKCQLSKINALSSEHDGRRANFVSSLLFFTLTDRSSQRMHPHWLTGRCEPQNQLSRWLILRDVIVLIWRGESVDQLLGGGLTEAHYNMKQIT